MAKAFAVPRGEFGVGLIELMIAMGLSLLIGLAVIEVFLGQRQLYVAQEDQSRMQENARFVFEQISHDLRMVGYWGCSNKVTLTNNTGDSSYALLKDKAVVLATDGTLNLKFLNPDPGSRRVVPHAGAIDISTMSNTVPLLAANCSRAELFMRSTGMPSGYAEGTEVFELSSVNYKKNGDKIQKNGVDLIDNVSTLDFSFGTSASDYVTAYEATPADWSQVKSVKVTLQLTSQHAGTKEFKSVIAIRNRLP
jgi:type IV pilus assembly protein PilW